MDIHRLRIVNYPASPINALAFSHQPNPAHRAPGTLRLAVGRANGDIELWNPSEGHWVQERILHGSEDRSIEGLAWTQDPTYENEDGQIMGGQLRLFSIGYSNTVTEWDIYRGKPERLTDGGGSEIWCFAAQPRSTSKPLDAASVEGGKHHQKLIAGCADGTLSLLSTVGELRYGSKLPPPHSRKAKVLSVTWQTSDRVVAGYSDNAIRVYDIRGRARNIQTMSLAPDGKRPDTDVLVWAVRCLPDGTIISGDSSGEVKIWDAATLSLVQQLKSHNADVLTLSPSFDGSTMLSGGIDRRTVTYQRIASGKNKGRWAVASYRRLHASDVKSMASYEAKDLNVVVSGGLDATPIVLPRSGVGLEHHRRLAVYPNIPPLQSAPSRRLIMSYWGTEARIWRVDRYEPDEEGGYDGGLAHRLMKTIKLSATGQKNLAAGTRFSLGNESITSASLAQDGSMLAIATVSSTKVFRLVHNPGRSLPISKLKAPPDFDHGSGHIEFSPDQKWLFQVGEFKLRLWRICWDESNEEYQVKPRPVRLVRKVRSMKKVKSRGGTHGEYLQSIQRGAWSSNSRILVVCDLQGRFDSWVLEGHEDLTQTYEDTPSRELEETSEDDSDDEEQAVVFGQRWVRLDTALPKLGSSPLVLSFRPDLSTKDQQATVTLHPTRHNPHPVAHEVPDGEDRLVVVSSKHQIFEYHVMQGSFTDWSRRNPPETFPQEYQNIRERAMGCVWDVSADAARLWLYGSSWLWMFNLSVDMQQDQHFPNGVDNPTTAISKKRKRIVAEESQLMKNTSGAGSRIHPAVQDSGMMPAMLETDGDATNWVSFEKSGEEHVASESTDLVRLRRGQPNGAHEPDGHNGDVAMARSKEHDDEEDHPPTLVRHWGTFKYRPILGIVPLSTSATPESQARAENVEVALVERPLWDAKLPARWEGDQEWKK